MVEGVLPPYDVVIPTYNRATIVGDAVRSVARQHPPPQRIVVVDDASADATAATLQSLCSSVSSLTAVTLTSNAGVSAARNAGLALVTSPWVAFLDSDDVWLPGAAQALLTTCRRNNADVATGFFARQAVDGAIGPKECSWSGRDIVAELAHKCVLGLSWSMMSRDLVNMLGGYDATLRDCEDWDFFVRAAAAGAVFARCEQVVALYRTPDGPRLMDDADPDGRNVAKVLGHSILGGPR